MEGRKFDGLYHIDLRGQKKFDNVRYLEQINGFPIKILASESEKTETGRGGLQK